MNHIITIGREFGSGGRELGRRLSEKLQIAYYDQEIVTEISKRTNFAEEYIQQITERRPITPFSIHTRQSFYPQLNPVLQQSVSVYTEQHNLLQELSEKWDCLIVGRCADYILREKAPFRIFIYADTPSKLRRCMEKRQVKEDLSESELKKKMDLIDRNRAKYYEFFSGQKWSEYKNYDLMINTTDADIEKMAIAIAQYLKEFERK